MSLFNRFLSEVQIGMTGAREGLNIGLPALSGYVPNVQKKHYYILGGSTGSGKSTIMLDNFFANPAEHVMELQKGDNLLNIDIEGLFYSFEVDMIRVIAKLIARKIYKDTKKTLPVMYIMSNKNRCSQEDYELVRSYDKYWEFFESKFKFIDSPVNPTAVHKEIQAMAARNGTIFTKNVPYADMPVFDKYVPTNPNKYLLVYIDHLSLTLRERGLSRSEAMELMSSYILEDRNKYGITGFLLMQLNMEIFSPERVKINRLEPTLDDFGLSKKITQDAEVVMALHNPMMFNQLMYCGYDINRLKDNFRSIEVLKNRFGECNKKVGLFFNGAVGISGELPNPTNNQQMKEIYKAIDEMRKV